MNFPRVSECCHALPPKYGELVDHEGRCQDCGGWAKFIPEDELEPALRQQFGEGECRGCNRLDCEDCFQAMGR